MKKILLIILVLMFSIIPTMASEDGISISIKNNSINIYGYTITTLVGKVSAGFFSPLNETMSNYTFICDDVNVRVTDSNGNITNQTFQNNCRVNLLYSKDIPMTINQSYTTIIGDTQLQRNYEDCIGLKSQYSAGLDACTIEKNKREDASANYTQCSTDLQICGSKRDEAISAKTTMETNQKENENQKWIYAAGAFILGLAAMAFYMGKIGGPKIDRPEDKFNQQQAT
jgi:hypothetical protein